ncbi:hypothetical protein KAU32_08645 [bacterium]|nr:hypothetical protein [bacterium]
MKIKISLIISIIALLVGVLALIISYKRTDDSVIYRSLYKSAKWESLRGYHVQKIGPGLTAGTIKKPIYLTYLQRLEDEINHDPGNFLLYLLYFEKVFDDNAFVSDLRKNRKEKDISIARKMIKNVNVKYLPWDESATYKWFLARFQKVYRIGI